MHASLHNTVIAGNTKYCDTQPGFIATTCKPCKPGAMTRKVVQCVVLPFQHLAQWSYAFTCDCNPLAMHDRTDKHRQSEARRNTQLSACCRRATPTVKQQHITAQAGSTKGYNKLQLHFWCCAAAACAELCVSGPTWQVASDLQRLGS